MERLKREYRFYWNAACEYDDISPLTLFAVFSDDNPYVPIHNRLMIQLQAKLAV